MSISKNLQQNIVYSMYEERNSIVMKGNISNATIDSIIEPLNKIVIDDDLGGNVEMNAKLVFVVYDKSLDITLMIFKSNFLTPSLNRFFNEKTSSDILIEKGLQLEVVEVMEDDDNDSFVWCEHTKSGILNFLAKMGCKSSDIKIEIESGDFVMNSDPCSIEVFDAKFEFNHEKTCKNFTVKNLQLDLNEANLYAYIKQEIANATTAEIVSRIFEKYEKYGSTNNEDIFNILTEAGLKDDEDELCDVLGVNNFNEIRDAESDTANEMQN